MGGGLQLLTAQGQWVEVAVSEGDWKEGAGWVEGGIVWVGSESTVGSGGLGWRAERGCTQGYRFSGELQQTGSHAANQTVRRQDGCEIAPAGKQAILWHIRAHRSLLESGWHIAPMLRFSNYTAGWTAS